MRKYTQTDHRRPIRAGIKSGQLFLSVVAIGFLLSNLRFTVAQSNSVTYDNPLVYIGMDGNFYVTSLDDTRTTAVTSGMIAIPGVGINPPPIHFSGAAHWSPDGTRFAFVDGKSAIYVVESGQAPKLLVSANTDLDNGSLAWSPHRDELAYLTGMWSTSDSDVIHIVALDGTLVRKVKLPGGQGAGGSSGPGPERAMLWLGEDRDEDIFYHSNIAPTWTTRGFVFSGGWYGATFLLSEGGDIIWKFRSLDYPIVSPDSDNTYVIGSDLVLPSTEDPEYIPQPILINLYSAAEVPLPFGIGAEPLAWTHDGKSVIFGTRTPYKMMKRNGVLCHEEECKDRFDYILTLWRQGLDQNQKQPTMLFRHEGYDFGKVTVSADDSAVAFSLISNRNFDKVDPEVQIVAVPMSGGQPEWIAIGVKPAFGNGPFTAVPAGQPLVPQSQCSGSLPSRLIVGQRAKVTVGAPNILRALPGKGADLRTMNAGNTMLVLDGPTCGPEGLAWWKVNFHGTVGWTAESNSKNYWLEP